MTITAKEVAGLLAAAKDKSNPDNLPRYVWDSICECANIALEIKVYQIADLVAKQAAEIEQQKYMIDLFFARHEDLAAEIVRDLARGPLKQLKAEEIQ
jgi:hypothetical protein